MKEKQIIKCLRIMRDWGVCTYKGDFASELLDLIEQKNQELKPDLIGYRYIHDDDHILKIAHRQKYKIILYPVETTKGLEWAAEFRELKFCRGGGKLLEEAVSEAYENLEIYLKQLKEAEKEIPSPLED